MADNFFDNDRPARIRNEPWADDPPPADEGDYGDVRAFPTGERFEKPRTTAIHLTYFNEIEPALDAADFVQSLLIEASSVVVYGDSNSGKTFWTTDLALHVAAGIEWNGRRVEQGGEGRVRAGRRTSQWSGEKPGEIALMEWCIGFLPNAGTILDPFMGSGTTGVACAAGSRRSGRSWACSDATDHTRNTSMTDNHDQDGPGLSIPWPPAWAVHQHRRKVVQIILWQGDLCALCDDGTIHYRKLGKDDKEYEWVQVPNLPDGCGPYTGPDLIGRPVALEGGWRQDFEIQLRQVDLDDGRTLIKGINLPGFNLFVQPDESVADEVNRALSTFWPLYATAQADLRYHGSGVPPWTIAQHTTTFEL